MDDHVEGIAGTTLSLTNSNPHVSRTTTTNKLIERVVFDRILPAAEKSYLRERGEYVAADFAALQIAKQNHRELVRLELLRCQLVRLDASSSALASLSSSKLLSLRLGSYAAQLNQLQKSYQ